MYKNSSLTKLNFFSSDICLLTKLSLVCTYQIVITKSSLPNCRYQIVVTRLSLPISAHLYGLYPPLLIWILAIPPSLMDACYISLSHGSLLYLPLSCMLALPPFLGDIYDTSLSYGCLLYIHLSWMLAIPSSLMKDCYSSLSHDSLLYLLFHGGLLYLPLS